MGKFTKLSVFAFSLALGLASSSYAATATKQHSAKKIENGVYTNSITNKKNAHTFSVAIPEYKEQGEAKATTITENVSPQQTFVAFGAANKDHSYYRLDVMPANPKVPLFQIKDQLFNALAQEASAFGGDMKQVNSGKMKLDGHNGFYRVYTQQSPGVNMPTGQVTKKHAADIAKPQTYTHSMFIANVDKYIVIFWFQGSDLGGASNPYAITEANREQVIDFKYQPYANFIKSFQITKHYRTEQPSHQQTAAKTATATAAAATATTASKAQSTHGAAIDVETTDANGNSIISAPDRVYGVCRTEECMQKAEKKS